MILVTGGLGYIGSHMAAILLANGHDVILVDNLCNSKMEVLERLEYLSGRYVTFIRMDVRNTPALQRAIEQYAVTGIVHCAANKTIPDAVIHPLDFYNNNLTCTTSILRAMQRSSVKTLLFSSSLAVYGISQREPVTESMPLHPLNSYVKTVQMAEQIIEDVVRAESDWRVAIARYGNVAGAFPTGVLGEFNSSLNANISTALAKVGRHETDYFDVQGDQHPTPDGTAVRDYIHVMDAVEANMHILGWLFNQQEAFEIFNIASGTGTSVNEFAEQFAAVTGQGIQIKIVEPRPSEISSLIANVDKAKTLLNWQAKKTVKHIIEDNWRFHQLLKPQ